MWGYVNFEFKQFFTNKKNIAVLALLTFTAIFYAFRLAPAYDPIEKVSYDEIEATYLNTSGISRFYRRGKFMGLPSIRRLCC